MHPINQPAGLRVTAHGALASESRVCPGGARWLVAGGQHVQKREEVRFWNREGPISAS